MNNIESWEFAAATEGYQLFTGENKEYVLRSAILSMYAAARIHLLSQGIDSEERELTDEQKAFYYHTTVTLATMVLELVSHDLDRVEKD